MSGTLRLKGSTSGYSELQAPAVAGDQTFILPVEGGTLLTTDSPFPTLTLESGVVTSPSLTFEGDSNTGIYSPGANQVAITTGGGQRLFVDFDGNIGIGTDSPSELLTIGDISNTDSYISVKSANNTEAGIKFYGDLSGTKGINLGYEGNGNLLFIREDNAGTLTDRFVIDDSGNVGIGTDDPGVKLEVARLGAAWTGTSPVSGTGLFIHNGNNATSSPIHLTLGAGSGSSSSIFFADEVNNDIGAITYRHTENSMAFDVGDTEMMRIDSSGNVGIGTDSPQSELTVRGSTPQITLEPTADTQTCRLQFCTTDETIQSTIQSGGSLGGAIKFVQSSSERMRIDSSGNVGIGTDSPQEKLHIREGDIIIGQSSGNSTNIRNYIKFGRDGAPKAAIGFLNDTSNGRGDLLFMNSIVSDGNEFTDSDEVMRIDVNQRLVLGSISPVTSIDYSVCTSGRVQANAVYNATTASAANVVIASNGLFIRSTSSARFKTDIETLENSYADKLLECRPVWYRSIATDDTAHPEWGYYGFIAEEVADVDPRLVHFGQQEDGTLQPEGVQYTQMIAHLVNIVKRQKQQLVDFEARLSTLETAN